MKNFLFLFLFIIYICTSCAPLSQDQKTTYQLRWLGTAAWKLDYKGTTILIDPYLSRKSLTNKEGKEDWNQIWESDTNSIELALQKAKIDHVNGIFITHSHFDHFADVPYLLKKFPGTAVYGSATTCHIIVGITPSAKCIDISHQKHIKLAEIDIKIIPSLHTLIGPEKKIPFPGFLDSPPKMPLKVNEYVEGGSFMFYFQGQGLDFLYQGSANFIEKELTGPHPTVMTLASVWSENVDRYKERLIGKLQPKKIFLNHFENFLLPYTAGVVPLNQEKLDQFMTELKTWNKSVEVVIPNFFEEIVLEN